MDEHDLNTLDEELRAIRLDDGPKLQPLRLDQMFLRARQWREAHPESASISTPIYRPPSPRRYPRIYPLPLPLLPPAETVDQGGHELARETNEEKGVDDGGISPLASPLASLFRYPELVPLVLDHFDRPSDLAKICRVSREWNAIGRQKLYEHIWIRPCECDSSTLEVGTSLTLRGTQGKMAATSKYVLPLTPSA